MLGHSISYLKSGLFKSMELPETLPLNAPEFLHLGCFFQQLYFMSTIPKKASSFFNGEQLFSIAKRSNFMGQLFEILLRPCIIRVPSHDRIPVHRFRTVWSRTSRIKVICKVNFTNILSSAFFHDYFFSQYCDKYCVWIRRLKR